MKKLFEQIIKFGLVGIVCTIIDFVITLAISAIFRNLGQDVTAAAMIGGFFGFTISLIVNYILSMKYVFARREDMDRKKEFIIFVVLSVIGCGINELLIKGSMFVLENNFANTILYKYPTIATTVAKIVATAVVMVYNFVTRKIFLEKKSVNES